VTMLLLVAVRTRAGTPLKLTATGAGVKPAPEIVTTVPGGPLDGARTVITGLTMTVNVRRAGVGSSLPARSRAFTSNACEPSPSSPSVTLVVEANELQVPPSSRQANSRSACAVIASLPVNVNVVCAAAISPSGPLAMIGSGGVLSAMIERPTTVDSLPAASVAWADSVCAPSSAVVVSQAAEAVTVDAGGAGSSVVESNRPDARSITSATPLPS